MKTGIIICIGLALVALTMWGLAQSATPEAKAQKREHMTAGIIGPAHPAPDVTCWMTKSYDGGANALSCYPSLPPLPEVTCAN